MIRVTRGAKIFSCLRTPPLSAIVKVARRNFRNSSKNSSALIHLVPQQVSILFAVDWISETNRAIRSSLVATPRLPPIIPLVLREISGLSPYILSITPPYCSATLSRLADFRWASSRLLTPLGWELQGFAKEIKFDSVAVSATMQKEPRFSMISIFSSFRPMYLNRLPFFHSVL